MLVSLGDLLDSDGIEELLKTFKCSKNAELQDFLHEKALKLEASHHTRTYILFSQEGRIEGFSLSRSIYLKQTISVRLLSKNLALATMLAWSACRVSYWGNLEKMIALVLVVMSCCEMLSR